MVSKQKQEGRAMNTGPYKISFVKKAAVPLADKEKVSPWDVMESGTIGRREDTITIRGTWRVSAIGNFLGGGLLGVLLIRPFFAKSREQSIPVQQVERVVVRKKWSGKVYHLFQSRDDGISEVHAFTAYAERNVPDIEEFLRGIVPRNCFETAS
jgi:hypothetical protein